MVKHHNYFAIIIAILAVTIIPHLASSNSHGHGHNLVPIPSTEILEQASEQLQNMTSKAMSVDEWLFSEDLFPGHVIPQNIHHAEAVKLFNVLLEDNELFSQAYEKYRTQHNKEIDADDLKIEARKVHFRENLHNIFQHNLHADSGQFRFQVGVNMFADYSRQEMSHFLGELPIDPKNSNGGNPNPYLPPHFTPYNVAPPVSNGPFPLSYDLRKEYTISPVKNQKKCGSCVFFSHGGLLEALHNLKNGGDVINVSEQMMLDCGVRQHGYENNYGCDGNIMEDTGRFLIEHGVTAEHLYKYQAKQGNCSKDGKDIVAKLKDYWQIDPTVEAFKNTLVNLKLPIAAAFYVYPQFMFYRSGLFDWCVPLNGMIGGHAVLIVGYGHFFDQEYYIVKNSWGTRWGEAGYFKYAVGSNHCNFETWGFTGVLE